MTILRTHLNVEYNYTDTDIKIRDHCHITGKYRGSAQRDLKPILNQTTNFLSCLKT